MTCSACPEPNYCNECCKDTHEFLFTNRGDGAGHVPQPISDVPDPMQCARGVSTGGRACSSMVPGKVQLLGGRFCVNHSCKFAGCLNSRSSTESKCEEHLAAPSPPPRSVEERALSNAPSNAPTTSVRRRMSADSNQGDAFQLAATQNFRKAKLALNELMKTVR